MNQPLTRTSVARINPAAVENQLYEARKKIYPRKVAGSFAGWRWALVWLTQIIFYGTPWLAWNDRQAVLFDLAARKFYIFGIVFWPQDFILLTGLLVVSALALFLFTAIAGRLFCGYACPQTVYTEMFVWVEQRLEGDRHRQMKLDAEPWGPRKLIIKAAKHALWIVMGLWTGFTFVGYFTPIKELWGAVWNLGTGPWETFWVLFYGFATWGNAGFMREQVCKYMCPYARFQSVMFDPDTLIVTYDEKRGEPRGARGKGADYKGKGLGDCVNCGICVQVCPTGIDIRQGLQYECIGCGACIDGCNEVMDKMGYSRGLIRYSTENVMLGKHPDRKIASHIVRPRVLVYTAILAAFTAALLAAIYLRVPLKVNIIRDRANLVRYTDDGMVENVYRLQIMNTAERPRSFNISVTGMDGITMHADAPVPVQVHGASSRIVPVRVRVAPQIVKPGSNRIEFQVSALDDPGLKISEKTSFLAR